MKKMIIKDADINLNIDPDTGFMHVKGTISRTGIQEYLGHELGNEDAPMEVFNVYRSKDEVLSPESLESFKNVTVTDDHPSEFVDINNHNDLSRGSMASVEAFEKDGIDYIKTDIIITNQDLIDKAQKGKIELSVGYTQDLVESSGEFMGEAYQYLQTNIRANHIAVVMNGRCGGECSLSNDKKSVIINAENKTTEENDVKVTINGEEFDIPSEVAEELKKLNAKSKEDEKTAEDMEEEKTDMEAEKKDMEAKAKESEEKASEDAKAIDTMKATIDSLEEKVAKATSKTSDADINKLVTERASLLVMAKDNDVTADCKMNAIDIKKAILEKHTNVDLKDKSSVYVDARFDIYQEDKQAQKDSHDSLAKDLADGKKVSDESVSRDERIKANQSKFKQPGAK